MCKLLLSINQKNKKEIIEKFIEQIKKIKNLLHTKNGFFFIMVIYL